VPGRRFDKTTVFPNSWQIAVLPSKTAQTPDSRQYVGLGKLLACLNVAYLLFTYLDLSTSRSALPRESDPNFERVLYLPQHGVSPVITGASHQPFRFFIVLAGQTKTDENFRWIRSHRAREMLLSDSIGWAYQDDSERSSRRKANEAETGWSGGANRLISRRRDPPGKGPRCANFYVAFGTFVGI